IPRPCGATVVTGPNGEVRYVFSDPTTAPPGQATTAPAVDPNPNCHPVTTTSTTAAEDRVPVGGEVVVSFTTAEVNGPNPRSLPLTGEARVKRVDAAGRRWSTSVTVSGALPNVVHTFGIVTVAE